MIDIKQLKTAIDTGKVEIGYKKTIESLMLSEPKLIIVSRDIPQDMRESIEYYCKLASIPVETTKENSVDIGSSIGRSYAIASISILDAGESNIAGA